MGVVHAVVNHTRSGVGRNRTEGKTNRTRTLEPLAACCEITFLPFPPLGRKVLHREKKQRGERYISLLVRGYANTVATEH